MKTISNEDMSKVEGGLLFIPILIGGFLLLMAKAREDQQEINERMCIEPHRSSLF
ncbi:MAG: hypothetical protein H0V44_06100 [Planctomycetes bacterium]|nr:hypothetical protein [Planctomycetota bacterium]